MPKAPEPEAVAAGTRFGALMSLGADRVSAVEGYLAAGQPTAQIAQIIQGEWEQLLDVREATLIKMLQRYMDRVIRPRLTLAVETTRSSARTLPSALRDFSGRIDTIREMEHLLELQIARRDKARLHEEKGPLTMDLVDKQMALTHTMLRTLFTMQAEVGIVRRVPKSLTGTVEMDGSALKFEAEISDVEQFRSAVSRATSILEGAFSEVASS